MKLHHSKTIISALTAFFIAAGGVHAEGDSDSAEAAAMDSEESMAEKWNETMKKIGSYTADQRDQALETGRETLEVMDERIERMEAWTSEHWDSLSEEAREQKTRALKATREQRRKVAEWYGGMKHSSAEAWDGVKQGFISSYEKLQSVYNNAADSSGSDGETPEESDSDE